MNANLPFSARMPELRTLENGRLSVHFGNFDESVRQIGETAGAFAVSLDRSADAMRRLGAAMSSAKEMLDVAGENIDQTSVFCCLFKKAHGHYSEAIRLTAEIALGEAAHSLSASLYLCRGHISLVLYRFGDDSTDALRSATADLVKSVELNPVAETYMHLAEAYVEADDLDAAMESLENAIELDPEHALAFLLKGRIHQVNGEIEAAHDNIYEAILLDPELYREEFKPIVEDAEKWDAIWDETLKSPDSIAMLREMVDESKKALKQG